VVSRSPFPPPSERLTTLTGMLASITVRAVHPGVPGAAHRP
jgi:hypothetical protein